MIRIITARRLERLEATVETLRAELAAVKAFAREQTIRLDLMTQSRDHWRAESSTWEKRASRFIDQVGIKSDTLSAPAMAEPVPPPQAPARQVMTALAVTEIHKQTSPHPPQATTDILGVSEQAARDAIAGVLAGS